MPVRRPLALSALVCLVAAPAVAQAQPHMTPPPAAPPPAGSWVAEIQGLASAMNPQGQCIEHCYALDRLRLRGSASTGKLDFELEGALLASGPVEIPLFGTPQAVTVENARINGAPATIGFDGDHYFLHTSERRFTLTGRIVMNEDRALTIPGPLNRVESDVTDGRLTEGERLSGVVGQTIHFDSEATERTPDPTVFQLSRAVRVARETTFEYRLTMRSGADLGVVRLPLKYGERVLDVTGSVGWKVEGEDLVLPTAGKAAEITVTGTLSKLGSFTPDPRSPNEWWLLESDAEHRVSVAGDAKQFDASTSPMARTQPTSHLFMVQRGQHLDVTAQTLSSLEVLAATVRSHTRRVVLTTGGELVAQDDITYDNRGVDEIGWLPDGKVVFLATDGRSERLLHKEGSSEISVPLQSGAHTARLQTVREQHTGALGGWLSVEVPMLPLTASRTELDLGLPEGLTPALATGGDTPYVPFGARDGIAAAIAAIVSIALLRGWKSRALGTAALAGLWFVWAPAFVVGLGALATGGVAWVLSRLLRGRKRAALWTALATAGLLLGGFMLFARARDRAVMPFAPLGSAEESREVDVAARTLMTGEDGRDLAFAGHAAMDQAPQTKVAQGKIAMGPTTAPATLALGGYVNGVSSVELTLPSSARTISSSRELVTPGHPMRVTLFYVTTAGLWGLFALWALATLALARRHTDALRALHARFKEKLAASEPKDATPTTAAPADQAPTAAE